MSFYISLVLAIDAIIGAYVIILFLHIKGQRQIQEKYQLKKKKVFDKYLLLDAEAIVNNYQRRKKIFRAVKELEEEDEEYDT